MCNTAKISDSYLACWTIVILWIGIHFCPHRSSLTAFSSVLTFKFKSLCRLLFSKFFCNDRHGLAIITTLKKFSSRMSCEDKNRLQLCYVLHSGTLTGEKGLRIQIYVSLSNLKKKHDNVMLFTHLSKD